MHVKAKFVAGMCGIFLMTVGCTPDTKPTNAKLEKSINAYFEGRNECIFPTGLKFPYEVTPGSDEKKDKKQMEAMKAAGLVKEQGAAAIHAEVYTLSPLGERVAPRFCYGHRVVKTVDSFTPPLKQANGFVETTVSYHYSMMDVPVWVKTDEMKAAFPAMAKGISDDASDQIVLATVGAGWQVPE
jgi:hypothetical protein